MSSSTLSHEALHVTPVAHEIRGWPGRIEGDRVIQLAAQTLSRSSPAAGRRASTRSTRWTRCVCSRPSAARPRCATSTRSRAHVKNARAVTGRGEVPAGVVRDPGLLLLEPAAIYGPDEEIPYPEGTKELDYELEVAVVMGADGAIGGFTVMNDWSARDLQRQEMKVRLGRRRARTSRPRSGRSWSRRTSSATCAWRWSRA